MGFGGADAVRQLDQALRRATDRTAAVASEMSPAVEKHFRQMAKWHQAKFVESIRASTGANVSPLMSVDAAESALQIATRRHVALIKGLNAEMAKKVETAVLDSFESRYAIRDLRKRLTDDLGFAEGRAKIIAQDQIGKYTVALDRARHEEAGVTKYRWWTQLDDKVRPSHAEKHGEIFSWDDPPSDTGHPGEDINCRCRPMAYVEPRN